MPPSPVFFHHFFSLLPCVLFSKTLCFLILSLFTDEFPLLARQQSFRLGSTVSCFTSGTHVKNDVNILHHRNSNYVNVYPWTDLIAALHQRKFSLLNMVSLFTLKRNIHMYDKRKKKDALYTN